MDAAYYKFVLLKNKPSTEPVLTGSGVFNYILFKLSHLDSLDFSLPTKCPMSTNIMCSYKNTQPYPCRNTADLVLALIYSLKYVLSFNVFLIVFMVFDKLMQIQNRFLVRCHVI